jgi:outer membrane protein OmpA-like peptidoglycan-associated protein
VTDLRRLSTRVLVLALCGMPLAGTAAANDAEVRRMIESLRPSAQAAPAASVAPASPAPTGRTRNLVIEPAAAPATGATASPTAAAPNHAAPSPAATTAATPAGAAPAGTGLSLAIAFEPNSAQLHPDSGATLGALVAAMLSTELRSRRFVIEGHTDATGSPAQNLRLSRERAEQVRLFLVTLGVDGERLRAVGKGASDPVNARDPRSPENRRVRVVALP